MDNDLISRAAIIREIERIRKSTKTLTGIDFLWMIETFPPVDAAPVVRCKNCRHYFPDYMNTIDGNVVVYRCELDHDYGRDDYFCADGERRCDNDT